MNRLALTLLTGTLAAASTAEELITNGGFELHNGPNGRNAGFGWVNDDYDFTFNVYDHRSQRFYTGPAPTSPGNWYFHTTGVLGAAVVYQAFDLAARFTAQDIDEGDVTFTFGAWLAGLSSQTDHARVQFEMFDQLGSLITAIVFDGDRFGPGSGFVGTVDGAAPTIQRWKRYAFEGVLPVGVRTARVAIYRDTVNNNANDNYVDNVSLTAVPTPGTAVLIAAGGCVLATRRRHAR